MNPYKISPGEKLNLAHVFDRFISWLLWNRVNGLEHYPNCKPPLSNVHLCCANHMAVDAEYDQFFRYMMLFSSADMVSGKYYSKDDMRKLLHKEKIAADSDKLAMLYRITVKEWETYMSQYIPD